MGEPEHRFGPGDIENITRIIVNLPSKIAAEKSAVKDILIFLREKLENNDPVIKGYTFSPYDEPIFSGDWYYRKGNKLYRDLLTILFVDIFLRREQEEYEDAVDMLHAEIAKRYTLYGVHQKSFWILSHSATLNVFANYEKEAKRGQKHLRDLFFGASKSDK